MTPRLKKMEALDFATGQYTGAIAHAERARLVSFGPVPGAGPEAIARAAGRLGALLGGRRAAKKTGALARLPGIAAAMLAR